MSDTVVNVSGLTHYYADRRALNNVSFHIRKGEIFCFLGPNGGGKTTMFKILSTIISPSVGKAQVCGHDVVGEPSEVRKHIGVVFQSPSLDIKLTVRENLRFHALLHGLKRRDALPRIDEALRQLNLTERAHEIVEKLSGGLQRRVEIAKGLLPNPEVLLLDEPSTGLDPGARIDLWRYLLELRKTTGITIVVTSHILSEAEHCDRLAILDGGNLVALDTPGKLKREVGGEVISIETKEAAQVQLALKKKFRLRSSLVENTVRVEKRDGHKFVPKIIEAFPGWISAVSVGTPTLEDVFIRRTGHKMHDEPPAGRGH